ncbi:hypothetical protein AAFF_G00019440 [Aldrovandia affinis]|uniref:Secreted protein n=1 Tax=Aldrovandia affinis TaxID=143900 RepID=A0AAD7S5Y7_9TELE|nr:hypothetical protein AAFF_G00019440 [Aldrovandia affinis]
MSHQANGGSLAHPQGGWQAVLLLLLRYWQGPMCQAHSTLMGIRMGRTPRDPARARDETRSGVTGCLGDGPLRARSPKRQDARA